MSLAYLDANSGSLVVSAVAAGFAGAAVAAKFGVRRVKGMFRKDGDQPASETNEQGEQQS